MLFNRFIKYSTLALLLTISLVRCEEHIAIKLLQKQQNKIDIKAFLAQQGQKFINKKLQQKIEQIQNERPKIQQLNFQSSAQEISENVDKSYTYFKEVIPLTNYINFQYIGEISVGKNKQPFSVLFDTGSNQLWLPQDQCESCSFATNRYHCESNQCGTTTDEIQYGQGYVKGYNSKDQISLGKKSTTYPFLSIFETKDLDGFQSDGIMGLGVNKKESIVNRLFMEKKIEKNIFSFKLSTIDMKNVPQDAQELPHDQDSQLIFGGYDEKLIDESDISYFQVVSSSYWAIKMDSARYNKKDLFNKKKDYRVALIDSGTSLIHMPTLDYQAFNRTVFEKNNNNCFEFGVILCMCSEKNIHKQPLLSMTFTDSDSNDQIINILPEYYIMYNQGYCIYLVGEFPSIGINNMWILGDVFMRQTYNIFDYDRKAIGIVNLDPEDEDGNSTSSGFGAVGKFFILILVLGIGGFLAKYIYDNYVKPRQPQQQQYQQQQYQYQQNQDIPLNPLNEQLV